MLLQAEAAALAERQVANKQRLEAFHAVKVHVAATLTSVSDHRRLLSPSAVALQDLPLTASCLMCGFV